MASAPPPLPPGFVVQQSGAPAAAPPPVAQQPRPVVAIGRPPREAPPQTPVNAEHDRLANVRLQQEIDANAPAPVGGAPVPGNPALHGEAYLSSLPQSDQAMVRALSDGRIPWPTGRAAVDPHFRSIVAATGQFDPTFDAVNYQSRLAARRNRTSGPMFNNGVAISTAIDHLGVLADATDRLNNMGDGSLDPLFFAHGVNAISNWAGTGARGHDVNSFSTAADAAATELTRAFRQAGGNETDVQGWRERLNAANTPGELHGAITTAIHLLQGRLAEQMTGYNQAMGRSDHPSELLSPTAREVMNRLDPTYIPPQQDSNDPAFQAASQQFPGVVSNIGGGGSPPNGPPPAAGPTGGHAVNAAGDPVTAADIPRAAGDLRLGGQTDAHVPFTQQQQADYINAIRGYEPGTLTVPILEREFQRTLGRPITGNQQEVVDYYNGTGHYQGQPRGRVPIGFEYTDETAAARAEREGADARLAAMTPEQRFYDSQNPLRHPVEAGFQAALHIPTLTGSETEGGAAFNRGVVDIPTAGFRDEINGMARGGTGIDDERALDRSDWQNHPFLRGGGELAGALAVPAAGPEAGLLRASLLSGAQGAAYGAGSAEGNFLQRLPSAAFGAGVGAAAPPLFALGGKAFNALASRSPRPGADQGVINALQDENIPGARPLADPSVRPAMAGMRSSVGGAGPVDASLEATRSAIADRAARLSGTGTVQPLNAMGGIVQQAGQRAIDAAKTQARSLYARGEAAAGASPIMPTTVLSTIDQHLADLGRAPGRNKGLISWLQEIRGDLVDSAGNPRPAMVQDMRGLRTDLQDGITQKGLTFTRADGIASSLADAARADVTRDLASNPQALRFYQRGDDIWKGMRTDATQLWERVNGPRNNPLPGERVVANLQTMMGNRGDIGRFGRIMSALTPGERADFVATTAENLGKSAPDQPFSPALFLRNTDSIGDGARRIMFGSAGVKSLDNLRIASRAYADTRGALNNTHSGEVVNWRQFWRGMFGLTAPTATGAVAGGTTGALIAGASSIALQAASAVRNNISARALMNPVVSDWARRVSGARTPGAVRTAIGQLTSIAARNPALQQELIPFRDSLLRAINDNGVQAGRAAASPNQGPDNANQ